MTPIQRINPFPPKRVVAIGLIVGGALYSGATLATSGYLSNVNSACGTNYGCDLCHTSPPALNSTGQDFRDSGLQTSTICPPTTPPPTPTPTCTDNDGDGFGTGTGCTGALDCNDNDAAIHPGATENCTDGIDNNCNSLVDTRDPNAVGCPVTASCTDSDGDQYAIEGGACGPIDCDDTDATLNPGASEICDDGIDNNCDGNIDAADTACAIMNGGGDDELKHRHDEAKRHQRRNRERSSDEDYGRQPESRDDD